MQELTLSLREGYNLGDRLRFTLCFSLRILGPSVAIQAAQKSVKHKK